MQSFHLFPEWLSCEDCEHNQNISSDCQAHHHYQHDELCVSVVQVFWPVIPALYGSRGVGRACHVCTVLQYGQVALGFRVELLSHNGCDSQRFSAFKESRVLVQSWKKSIIF